MMKDSTPTPATPTPSTAAAAATTSSTSPTVNKEKSTGNTAFRDTRAELGQLLKKKEEIEVCCFVFLSLGHDKNMDVIYRNLCRILKSKSMRLKRVI